MKIHTHWLLCLFEYGTVYHSRIARNFPFNIQKNCASHCNPTLLQEKAKIATTQISFFPQILPGACKGEKTVITITAENIEVEDGYESDESSDAMASFDFIVR